jgi:hypothetical protein
MKIQGNAPSSKLKEITSDLNQASEEMMQESWALENLGDLLAQAEAEADTAKAEAYARPEINNKEKVKSQEMRDILAAPHWEEQKKEWLKTKYARESKFEVVRCYRQRVSALQTMYNREKAELEALQYNQDGGA